jgi:hypothetical protein
MKLAWPFVPVFILVVGSAALPSEEGPVQVAFPILAGGPGISFADAPALIWGSLWDTPGLLVALTASDFYIKTDLGIENRNGASRMGVRIQPEGLQGDTLCVVLDLTSMARRAPPPLGGAPERVLGQTVSCMIINAAREPHKARHLSIKVEGRAGYEQFAGVWNLEPAPLPAEWNDPLWTLRKESSN